MILHTDVLQHRQRVIMLVLCTYLHVHPEVNFFVLCRKIKIERNVRSHSHTAIVFVEEM